MSCTYQEPGEVRPKIRGNNCKSSMVEWEGQQAWCVALPSHYLPAVQPWTIHFFISKVGIEWGKRGEKRNISTAYSILRAFTFLFMIQ